MALSMKTMEFQLHESLVQLQEMLTLLNFDREYLDLLEDSKTRIKTRKYHVAVMGEFKRGKSTLLNALLGTPVLPADATPTTAAVSRITYGQHERTVLFFRDGSSEEIPFSSLTDAVTKLTANGQAVSGSLREAVLYYPSVICQNYIDLIDTPGLNDEERMTRLTIDLLPQVDAVILPIHARSPFSMTEKNFVCQLLESDNIHDILFVVTFLDQLDEDDYVYENYMRALSDRIRREVFAELESRDAPEQVVRKAHSLLDSLNICGLSAALALKAFSTGKKSLLQESRFPEFQQLLLRVLTAGQSQNAVRTTVAAIEKVIGSLEAQNRKKMQMFQEAEKRLADRRAALNQFQQDLLPLLDRLLDGVEQDLDTACKKLFPLKNSVMTRFIKALSGVRENTHTAIFQAVSPVTEEIPAMAASALEQEVFPAVRARLSRCLEDVSRAAQSAGLLWDRASFDRPLLDCMEEELKKAAFRFTMPPYPPVNDLAQADIAGHMTCCIDQSVTELYWLMKYTCSEIRRQWYPLAFQTGGKSLQREEARLAEETEAEDTSKKVYLKNYQVLKQIAASVQEKNSGILKNLMEG